MKQTKKDISSWEVWPAEQGYLEPLVQKDTFSWKIWRAEQGYPEPLAQTKKRIYSAGYLVVMNVFWKTLKQT